MILAVAPALPLHAAGKYVAGAYIVFVVMLVVYLGIMTLRTGRTSRELAELHQELAERRAREGLQSAALPPDTVGTSAHRGTLEGATEPQREPAL